MTDDMFTSTFPTFFRNKRVKTGPKPTLPTTRGWKKNGIPSPTKKISRPPKSRPFRQRSPRGV